MLLITGIRLFLLLLIAAANVGVLTRAQNVQASCIDETSPKQSAKFDCGEDDKIITYVSMRSGTGSCQTPEGDRCFGLSPPLLVSKLNCYWKTRCNIDWPRAPIILPEECAGAKPGFLDLSYKCFHPDVIVGKINSLNTKEKKNPTTYLIDICSKLKDGGSEYELTGGSGLSGIIRSHDIYPWDYRSTTRTCVVNLFWPKDQKLVVSVDNLDLGEGDTLQIGNTTAEEIIENKSTDFLGSGHRFHTVFNFSVGYYSNGGKGFIICFKFTSRNYRSENSACDDITSGGNIYFNDEVVSPELDFNDLNFQEPTTNAPIVNETPKPTEETIALNPKCEKKKSEKKKKKCYDRLKKRGGSKKNRKPRDKKRRKKDKRSSDKSNN